MQRSDFLYLSKLLSKTAPLDFQDFEKDFLQIPSIRKKMKARHRLQKLYASPLTETRITRNNRPIDLHGFPLNFQYQRLGLHFEPTTHAHRYLYPSLRVPKELKSQGTWTSCGQVAISAVVSAYQHLGHKKIRLVSSEMYWESGIFFEKMRWQVHAKAPIAYLDSSMLTEPLSKALKKAAGCKDLIVDTTCWLQDDPCLTEILRWALRQGVRVSFVRSALKLDSFGMEYNRLGSAIWFCPPKSKMPKGLYEEFESLLRLWGGYASSSQLFPFWLDREFHEANQAWVQALQETNSNLVEHFEKNPPMAPFQFLPFEHRVFSWLITPNMSPESLEKFCSYFVESLRKKGLDAAQVSSYPWDFVALTSFNPSPAFSANKKKRGALRISLPALSKRQTQVFIQALLELMELTKDSFDSE